jgi:hypothetical protein
LLAISQIKIGEIIPHVLDLSRTSFWKVAARRFSSVTSNTDICEVEPSIDLEDFKLYRVWKLLHPLDQLLW